MLIKKYGCGKTLIMQAMVEMYNSVIHSLHIERPLLKFFKSSELLDMLKTSPSNIFPGCHLSLMSLEESQNKSWILAIHEVRWLNFCANDTIPEYVHMA
jgi:hypothetical protein